MARATILVGGLMMMAFGAGCGAAPKSGVLEDTTSHRTSQFAQLRADSPDYAMMQPDSYDVVWTTREVTPDGANSVPEATTLSPEKASTKDRLRFDTEVF